jgi:hypothetical protein
MSKADLRIDWATHEAAKYACEKWHYSGCIPKSKLAKLGVWEKAVFKGVIIYGVGATADLVKSYGLKQNEGCELVRIALRAHEAPVSRIMAISLKMLKASFPNLRLVVSFADPEQGHHGGVYQAANWVLAGMTQASDEYIYKGKRWQGRSFRNSHRGMERHPDVTVVKGSRKYRYLMPLDAEMRERIAPLAKPYPKRAKDQAASNPDALGGETPTRTLHYSEASHVQT